MSLNSTSTEHAAIARRFAGPVLIVLAGVLAYSGSLDGPFIFDDTNAIVDNLGVQSLRFVPFWLSHQRGVAFITFSLNHSSGAGTFGYHVVNLGIHLINGLLLYGITRRMLITPRLAPYFEQHAPQLALVVALVWTVHPLCTQGVTYIVQRMESLAALFYLLAIYGLIRGAEGRRRWFLVSIVACLLGMRTKETVFTAPVLLLWLDRAVLAASWREVWSRRLYYAALALVTGIAILPWAPELQAKLFPQLVTSDTDAPSSSNPTANVADDESAELVVKGVTPYQYLTTQTGVVLHYLRLSLLPVGLCFDHNWPVAENWPAIWIPGAVALLLVLFVLWAAVRFPPWGWLGGSFFLILAPTSTIIPIRDLCVEHRAYLPSAVVVAAIVLATYLALTRYHLRGTKQVERRLQIAGRVAIGIVVLLGAMTFVRNRAYASAVTIWADTIAKVPDNLRAHYNLARAIVELPKPTRGQANEARKHYEHVIERRPDSAWAHNSLALLLLRLNEPAAAREHFQKAVALRGDFVVAHNNLGILLAREGKLTEAIAQYQLALKLKPGYAEAHNNLGIALAKSDNLAGAIEHFKAAVRLKPDYESARKNLETTQQELDKGASNSSGNDAVK